MKWKIWDSVYKLGFINNYNLIYVTNETFYCCQTGGGAAAGGDKGAEPKKEVEELVLEDITISFLKQVWNIFLWKIYVPYSFFP